MARRQAIGDTTTTTADVEAERGVLGTLLGAPDTIHEIGWLTPDDFQIHRHREIYQAICDLAERGKEANMVTLPPEMGRQGQNGEDLSAYLLDLQTHVPSYQFGEHYAERVRQARRHQALYAAVTEAAKLATKVNGADQVVRIQKLLMLIDDQFPDPTVSKELVYSTAADLRKLLGPIEWDWPGWLPRGFATLVAAEPGVGKSSLALQVAATYIRGISWPDGTPFAGRTGRVLWCETEAGQSVMLDRLTKWSIPDERVIFPPANPLDSVSLENLRHLDTIRRLAQLDDTRLIVVDSFSGGHGRDENDAAAGSIIKTLAEIARDSNLPLIVIHHLNKLFRSNRVTLTNVRGSTAIAQYVRMVWAMDKPDTERPEAIRLYAIKNNLGPLPAEIGLTITGTGMECLSTVPQSPRGDSVVDQAVELLLDLLGREPLATREVQAAFEDAGLSIASLRRARSKLNVISIRQSNGKYMLSLPAKREEETLQ